MGTGQRKIREEIAISDSTLEKISQIDSVSEYKKAIESCFDLQLTILLETILAGSLKLKSSDIHIEPEQEKTQIRIRIDGILINVCSIDLGLYKSLVSRLKLLSGVKLNIYDKPQDGRFSVVYKDLNEVEVRLSTLPAEYGESIVLRLLNPKSLLSLEYLGLRKDILETIKKEIKRPNGMIVVTGPTGSGKTTTLYAFCKQIQNPEIKIITIEDPIEYHLQGISQTQVDTEKGYDFASGLKSIMRQDPDVILVGEIRDAETANIALQSALTGHLVLSTLHTNNAIGAIPRLISLGANSANIAPAINIIIAQRLVRKICPHCGKKEKISERDLKKLKSHLLKIDLDKLSIPKLTKNLEIVKPVGCKACNFTGYKERVGIFEIFPVDGEIEEFLSKKPSIAELRKLGIKKGMTTMKQDGFIKVIQGLTTIEEVEKITGE